MSNKIKLATLSVILIAQGFAAEFEPANQAVETAMATAEQPNVAEAPAIYRNPRATFERIMDTMSTGDLTDHHACFTEEGLEAIDADTSLTVEQLAEFKQNVLADGYTGKRIDSFSHSTINGKITIIAEFSSVKNARRFMEKGILILIQTENGWKAENFTITPLGNVAESE